MHTTRWVLVVLIVAATLGSPGVGAAAADTGCSFPVTRTDATGTTVTIAEDPDTVVTLNPSAAQTMYEIGAWDEVVGVSSFADYLPGADEKTTVGTGNSDATVERTIALDPDLVLAPNTIFDSTVQQLRDAGLTVYKFEAAEDLDDIEAKTRLTGELVGHCEDADTRANEFARQVDVVRDAVDDVDRPDVFYTFFGFTAGSDTFVNEVIETAGGNNIAADDAGINASGGDTSGFFSVNSEVVVAADPAWFVLNSDQYDTAEVPSGPGGVYEGTTAYEEGNAVVLDANEISQPAPRIVDAIVDLVRVLHPDAYENEIAGRIDPDLAEGERRVTAERLADGSLSLQADNIGRDDAVSFAVPARPNATVDVRRLNVTLSTVNPTFELRVRPAGDRAAPTGTRTLDTMEVSGNGIFARDIDHLTLRFAVNGSRLDGADPETVTLYRANESGWTPLRTTRVNATNGTLVYEARATGMPTLLVAVDEPRPVSPGTNATATATATSTAAPTATPTPTTTPTQTATTAPSTPGSAPGFGPLVALAAILLVARGWRR
ncbi:PGF-CTERM-anchored ABC transporter substrate-binding protein [Haloplanus natans]|uniref:PGF-CTERM-anchored ABC transporter substrate-binding protein n=1 Tax=Haloplanus natans TaxID=376171 RepID=UPI0006780396|nr:PGF-CTERM-anchored ABC transporter substrate-binding protein [Haloplanus natans]